MPHRSSRPAAALLALLLAVAALAGCGVGAAPPATAPAAEPTGEAPAGPTSGALVAGARSTATPIPVRLIGGAATAPATVAPTGAPDPQRRPTNTIPPAATAAPTSPAAARTPTAAPTGGPARVVSRGATTRRVVALTFDAGADRGYAEAILDTLRDGGAAASFGMTGRWAEQNPDLVARMVEEGHLLFNHTYSHASFTGRSPGTAPLTAEGRRREIERAEVAVRAVAGVELRPYFRPPYGDYDEAMLAQLGRLGYSHSVMWTVDSLGWDGASAARIVERCLAAAAPGAIVLMHVGADSQDAAALPELLRRLRAAGYAFGTLADLLP